MLYERAVRQCFQASVASLIQNFTDILGYLHDSTGRDLTTGDVKIGEEAVIHVAMDPVLAKRMEKRFLLDIDLVFNKEKGVVELSP